VRKIIIPVLFLLFTTFAVSAENSLYDLGVVDFDRPSRDQTFGLIGQYDVSTEFEADKTAATYDLFDDHSTRGNAWVGVAGPHGQLRVGRHDALDSMATKSADQSQSKGAYDLVMRGDDKVSNSLTYLKKEGAVSTGVQYVPDGKVAHKSSVGLLLNTQQGPYEAAIAYRRTPEDHKTIKGRVTYKSRNNSKIRVDLVAEKFAVGEVPEDEANSDSLSFMVGATYNITPKAYVVGQYGAVGFEQEDLRLSDDGVSFGRDYNALSFEAGYNLTESTSVFVSHTQKSYDSSKLTIPLLESDEGSQTNSIGVRLNW